MLPRSAHIHVNVLPGCFQISRARLQLLKRGFVLETHWHRLFGSGLARGRFPHVTSVRRASLARGRFPHVTSVHRASLARGRFPHVTTLRLQEAPFWSCQLQNGNCSSKMELLKWSFSNGAGSSKMELLENIKMELLK